MTEVNEIEMLQARREKLEVEARSLKEAQKHIENRVKVLEEKITIAELENHNKAMRENITKLESKMTQLESRLKEVTQPPSPTPEKEKLSEAAASTQPETAEAAFQDAQENTVIVEAIDNETAFESQEAIVEHEKQHEKKKSKFF